MSVTHAPAKCYKNLLVRMRALDRETEGRRERVDTSNTVDTDAESLAVSDFGSGRLDSRFPVPLSRFILNTIGCNLRLSHFRLGRAIKYGGHHSTKEGHEEKDGSQEKGRSAEESEEKGGKESYDP